jgi:signal transduction histidine kinase
VPNSLKTVIYRISQEALNNIAKHSKADRVTFSLRKIGDPIELAIQDNGQGFDVEQTLSKESHEQGLGLSSMRERVELTGGSFSIESNKGVGTVIRATWPV